MQKTSQQKINLDYLGRKFLIAFFNIYKQIKNLRSKNSELETANQELTHNKIEIKILLEKYHDYLE